MPTYEYYCYNCNSQSSYFQKMNESPLSSCESCGGEIKRLITGGSGLIFKGSGFYLTDYKNNKKSDQKDSKSIIDNNDSVKKSKIDKNKTSIDKSTQKKENLKK